jgi:molecular chaperone HtpG
LLLDSPIISHLIQKIEGDNKELTFVRVDSDHIDNLIKKENTISKLSDEEQEGLKQFWKLLFQNKLYRTTGSYGQPQRHHLSSRSLNSCVE